ncbi:MAG: hypothetical protein K2Y08_05590 [Alphaproteobacteria bacterium]|nr:hypothetical protein [Alphaproteobacteria bacterium]
MIRFSLLLTCSLLASTLVGEHPAFAMNQNEDNGNPPHQGIIALAPIDQDFWAAVADFFQIQPIQGATIPLQAENKERSE